MLPQFSYSSAEVKRVRKVQFGVLSPEEIKAMSVVEVTKPGTYNAGVPIRNGLNDPAMGAADRFSTCSTCKNTYAGSGKVNDCPGHFGHIELASPVWHIGFLPVVYKLLQCVCINCSRLLADKNKAEFKRASSIANGKKRLMALLKLCRSSRTCRGNSMPAGEEGAAGAGGISEADTGCGTAQPGYRREGTLITLEFKEEHVADMNLADRKQHLTPERAYAIFRNVSDEDVRTLGLNPRFARPEWLVLTVLPVAPPHVRPSVALDSLARADDDITHKYADIVKANIAVANAKKSGQPAVMVQQFERTLQYHVATIIDSSVPGLPNATQRGGKSLKTFRERLVGKGGRVRGNLMGKRVDFSARTVITADPNLSIHQVGVPRSIASNLTVPERVNRYNIRRLQALVERGPHEHPGCKYIIRDNGARIDLRHAKSAADLTLKYGYTVERHLMDDDTVLFNRQPTLHKMSIMCHKVKVLDYSTFRMNLTCTTPYNADFDGDEMNLHALQTLPAIAEASELMVVPRLIITAQKNGPVMGIVQDTLLGSRIFTYRDVFVRKDVLMNCVMWMSSWDGRLPQPAIMAPTRGKPGRHTPLWTGKQIMSMFIPEVNYSGAAQKVNDEGGFENLWPSDGAVLIEKGQLLTGMLDKSSLGNKGGSLLHVIMNDVSPEDCRDFINTAQRVVNYWLLHRGFSIGISDAEAPAATMAQVERSISDAMDKVKNIVHQAQRQNGLQRQPGQTMMQNFEALVNEVLNQARNTSSKAVVDVLDERSNAVLTMVAAGSKGADNNIAQIIACVAQQNVDGQRIGNGFRDRTLPHFMKFDLGPKAKGFVEHSYLQGLTPSEFFFHTMGGRVGLIDTAVKTAETGYIQRRLVKAMEDAMVRYDGTVRNSCNEVVQFLYGEDGMDARWIENNDLPSYKMGMPALRAAYEWNPDAPNFGRAGAGREVFIEAGVLEEMRLSMETRDALAREFEAICADRRVVAAAMRVGHDMVEKASAPLPLAVSRMILNAKRKFRIAGDAVSDLHPVRDVVEPLSALIGRLIIVPGRDALSREAQVNATAFVQALLRSQLASKRVMQVHRLSREAFTWLLGEIETRFNVGVAAAGEMCGVLAAQSLGEPATQMTLNTFHHAGVSAKNVTLGMPRLKELINIAKNIRTPSLTIFVRDALRADPKAALDRLQQALEYITLSDLVEQTSILYDPDPATTIVEEDRLFVETYAIAPDEGVNLEALSPWVLRLRLSRERMANRLIRLDEVKAKVKGVDGTLDVVDNGVNAPVPVLRIRISNATRLASEGGAEEDAEAAAARAAAGSTGDEDERTLRDFEQYLLHDLPLRGVPGVRKLFKSEHKGAVWTQEGGVAKAPPEPKFETEGSNLLPVLNLPEVDFARTFCNDVIEILTVLGIEACRQSLLNELRAVISFDGTYVNYRHMALLVDTMTFRGSLTAVTRHGINRVDSGPLIRSSFEETCEILMEAAAFAEVDDMRGASDNIMLGQMCPIGTGHCDVLLDEDRLREAIPVDAITQELLGAGAGAGASGLGAYVGSTPLLASPSDVGGGQSPYSASVYGASPGGGGPQFSPNAWTPQAALTPAFSPAMGGGGGGVSPGMMSPSAYAMSYSPASTSPSYGSSYVPQSPAFTPQEAEGAEYSPTSVMGGTPMASPAGSSLGSGSTGYSSSGMSPTSPSYGAGGGGAYGGASPSSPAYSPQSPAYSPSAGSGVTGATSTGGSHYSPTSPAFSDGAGSGSHMYSPQSPGYSPTSPAFSPQSGAAGAAGAGTASFSPTSPAYSPQSPAYSPQSPAYSPQSPAYSPQSPAYSPQSAASGPSLSSSGVSSGGSSGLSPSSVGAGGAAAGGYSPTSPAFSPQDANYSPSNTGHFSPTSPAYSPDSGGAGGKPRGPGGYSPAK